MKLHYAFIPLGLGSAVVLAGLVVQSQPEDPPGSSPEVIEIDPSVWGEPEPPSVVVGESDIEIDPETGFAKAAFPPTIPDRDWHRDAWTKNNCLDCHETGVGDAPMIRHKGLPNITWQSKCRSCHVLIPGNTDYTPPEQEPSPFASWAFPPMMPNNDSHAQAWGNNNCLLCHESGIRGAPIVKHKGMPRIMLKAKCRSCHVQVRSQMSSPFEEDLLDMPVQDAGKASNGASSLSSH